MMKKVGAFSLSSLCLVGLDESRGTKSEKLRFGVALMENMVENRVEKIVGKMRFLREIKIFQRGRSK
jgi:hypothetical protein